MHSTLSKVFGILFQCPLTTVSSLGAAEAGGADLLRRVTEVRGLSLSAMLQEHSVDWEGVVTYLRNSSKEQFNFNLLG